MDTNSRLFHKAQETIAKQASASAPSLTSPSPISGTKMPLDALMDLDPGMSTLLFFFHNYPLRTFYFSEVPASFFSEQDQAVVQRARDLITNATIADIVSDTPESTSAFATALRQQIVALCVRLRLSLIVINKLMTISVALSQDNK